VACQSGAEYRVGEDIPEGNVSTVCKACQSCSPGSTFETGACVPWKDRVCAGCTGGCGAGQRIVRDCNTTADTACAPCVTGCAAGQYRSTLETCSGTSKVDAVLASCARCLVVGDCTPGVSFLLSNCTGAETQINVCRGCSQLSCAEGFYSGGCGGYRDTTCLPRPTCSAGQFLLGASEIVAGACVPCRSCAAAGLAQVAACGLDKDARCGGQACNFTVGCTTAQAGDAGAYYCDVLPGAGSSAKGQCGVCPVSEFSSFRVLSLSV
jgi:hypothetical protein